MNKVILCGRLTRDAEARVGGANQQTITRFTIAVDRRLSAERRQQGGPTADFISCVAFGYTATFMEKYGRKGTKFIVEGRIQTGSYQDRDGKTVYTTDVVAENVEFAESGRNAEGGAIGAAAPVGGAQGGFTPNDVPSDGFINIADGIEEELPFS